MLWRQVTSVGDKFLISPASGGEFLLHVDFSEGRYQQQNFCWISQVKILEILRICLFADVLASLDLFPFACLPEIIAVARVNCRFILPSVGFTIIFFFCGIHSESCKSLYSSCKFVRLIFLLISVAAVKIVGFIFFFKRRTLCSFQCKP